MAGAGYKLFTTGSVLTAAEVNTYLQEQTVMVFADATARTTALSGVVAEGMLSYLKDTDVIQYYNGSSWTTVNTDQTPLTTKGDLFTYSTADARLAVGNNGETLVADSSATTGLRWQGNYAAGKNAIINGDMRIWQRGTTFNSIANNSYTADRWAWFYDGTATWNVSQQSFTPGTAPVAGYEAPFFLRASLSANTNGTYGNFYQKIEDVRTFAGQTITLSFWAKADSARSSLVYFIQNFGSGGSSAVTATQNVTYSTSWTRYSFTTTIASVSGKTIGTGSNLEIGIRTTNTSGSVLDIWGVQVEAGSVATAFQTATGTLAGELGLCQRYYWRIPASSTATFQVFSNTGWFNGTTTFEAVHRMPVTMRVAPTTLDWAGTLNVLDTAGSSVAVSAGVIGGGESNGDTVRVNWTVSGATSGRFGNLRAPGSATAFVGFGAEL